MGGDKISNHPDYIRMTQLLATLTDLSHIQSVLSWDQEVNMPSTAAKERAEQNGTLARLRHNMLLSDELVTLVEKLSNEVDVKSSEDSASLIRLMRRVHDKAGKLSEEFVQRRSEIASLAKVSWQQAKATENFSLFADDLKRIIEIKLEEADLQGYEDHPYDALLDDFEPEMKTAEVELFFASIKEPLVTLVREIGESQQVRDDFLRLDYDEKKQWDFGLEILKAIGYNMDRGGQHISAHPFTITLGPNDVRITTWRDSRLLPALFATIHEGGHGIHAQNMPSRFGKTPLAGSPGFGFSESQSRLFENVIGRSKRFWSHHYNRLQEFFPGQLGRVSPDDFYKAINRVEPSLVRVEADEVTYHLHIMLRFELEKEMLSGRFEVERLPDIWNEKMERLLGITPGSPSVGCLQDIHWSQGAMGYFPSYSMGSILAVQLYDLAISDVPEIEGELSQGRCDQLRMWMMENVYTHGKKFAPGKLIEKITGGPLNVRPFISYVTEKYGDIYDL